MAFLLDAMLLDHFRNPMNRFVNSGIQDTPKTTTSLLGVGDGTGSSKKTWFKCWNMISNSGYKIHHLFFQSLGFKRMGKTWWRKFLVGWIFIWLLISVWVLWYMSSQATKKRKEALASMCDERVRMLQDQFNVSMNHIQAMAILISAFHHGKNPSAIDQLR